MKIEEIGELSRVDVRPGDLFVIHCDKDLPVETMQRFTETWNHSMGPNPPKLIILTVGMKLGVVRQEAT